MTRQAARLAVTALLSFAAGSLVLSSLVCAQGARAASDRVFELRVYHALPGRLPRLQSNFREHNVRFLKKHGITSIGYWTPQDPPGSENTLIFLVAHDSREAAARNWKELREDPEWQKLTNASRADGEIVEKIDSTFLVPTDYSPSR